MSFIGKWLRSPQGLRVHTPKEAKCIWYLGGSVECTAVFGQYKTVLQEDTLEDVSCLLSKFAKSAAGVSACSLGHLAFLDN